MNNDESKTYPAANQFSNCNSTVTYITLYKNDYTKRHQQNVRHGAGLVARS